MNLIDKDALVAEIEKLREIYSKCPTRNNYEDGLKDGRILGYEDALYEINTLEVKEVDLEKEFESFLDNIEGVPRMWHSDEQIEWAKDIAKHFFELGLKVQKGE